jgi:hypothetical protein
MPASRDSSDFRKLEIALHLQHCARRVIAALDPGYWATLR